MIAWVSSSLAQLRIVIGSNTRDIDIYDIHTSMRNIPECWTGISFMYTFGSRVKKKEQTIYVWTNVNV